MVLASSPLRVVVVVAMVEKSSRLCGLRQQIRFKGERKNLWQRIETAED